MTTDDDDDNDNDNNGHHWNPNTNVRDHWWPEFTDDLANGRLTSDLSQPKHISITLISLLAQFFKTMALADHDRKQFTNNWQPGEETDEELTQSTMITLTPAVQLTILSHGSTVTISSRHTLHRLIITHIYSNWSDHCKNLTASNMNKDQKQDENFLKNW